MGVRPQRLELLPQGKAGGISGQCVRACVRSGGVWLIDRLSSVGLLAQLETFVRLAKIPYTNKLGLNFGKKGKMPWIKVSKGRGGE